MAAAALNLNEHIAVEDNHPSNPCSFSKGASAFLSAAASASVRCFFPLRTTSHAALFFRSVSWCSRTMEARNALRVWGGRAASTFSSFQLSSSTFFRSLCIIYTGINNDYIMLLAIQGVMGVFRSLARSASPHYPVVLHSPAATATFSPEPCGALWPLAAGLLE